MSLLDGTWNYGLHLGVIDTMSPDLDIKAPPWTPNNTMVPMSMDVAPPGVPGPRGVAVYRRRFVQEKGPARLHFNGCSFYCRVWVDGQDIGEHRAGGYVGFFLDIPSVNDNTERELLVLADNRFNSTTAPLHTGGDFWMYGGLVRSVLLHRMPLEGAGPWPWRVYVLPMEHGYKQGMVNITVQLTDPSFEGQLALHLQFDEGDAEKVTVKATKGTVVLPLMRVPNPRLWSTIDPQLHTLTVLAPGGEGVTERFGLRWWGVHAETARITLNGEVLKLHGWNHHMQWPDTGASPTDAQLDDSLRLLRAAGCNYVRGAHYPQDPRWLDRMDETGMAMWEETLGPAVRSNNMQDWGHFMKYQLKQIDEMLDMSLNHASVMTWGWFNEAESDNPRSCPAFAACSNRVKERDPTRFRTWADMKTSRGKCYEHASLIAFNSYPGWYQDPNKSDAPAKWWNMYAQWVHETWPTKPFVISETGAGGVYEWGANNLTAVMWTQLYQKEVLENNVDVALSNERFSGITLWHFFDFKINDQDTALCGPCELIPGVEPPTCAYVDVGCKRPAGKNHKGVVDMWRREKITYHAVAVKYNASLAAARLARASREGAETIVV